jgi:O-antigen ligase
MLFKASKFFLHAAVFSVILVSTSTLFPFIVGKYVWFRTVVDLALIFFLAGLMFNPDAGHYISRLKQLFKSPVTIAVTAFAAFFVLASFFGVRPSFSFWSNFERGEGGLQILNLYVFFVLLATLFREDRDWRKMFWLSMGAASLMILYGIIAGFGGSFGGWGQIGPVFGEPGFRFEGSLGNSEYVPGYLVFIMFFASYLLLSVKRSWGSPQSTGLIALILFFFTFCLMSGTRGAFVGLIAGALATVVYIGIYKKPWRKWLIAGAAIMVMTVALLVHFRPAPFVKYFPGASSILRLSLSEHDLADLTTRFVMWDTAVQGWKERPLLGWGPENFLVLFDKHYEIRYYNPEAGFGAWFDRAHSTVFDYLAQIGALGLLSYLAIFVCLGLLLLKKKWREAAKLDSRRAIIQGLFLGIIVTYLVQGTVLFDVFALYLPLFTLFAFAVYYFRLAEPAEKKSIQTKP